MEKTATRRFEVWHNRTGLRTSKLIEAENHLEAVKKFLGLPPAVQTNGSRWSIGVRQEGAGTEAGFVYDMEMTNGVLARMTPFRKSDGQEPVPEDLILKAYLGDPPDKPNGFLAQIQGTIMGDVLTKHSPLIQDVKDFLVMELSDDLPAIEEGETLDGIEPNAIPALSALEAAREFISDFSGFPEGVVWFIGVNDYTDSLWQFYEVLTKSDGDPVLGRVGVKQSIPQRGVGMAEEPNLYTCWAAAEGMSTQKAIMAYSPEQAAVLWASTYATTTDKTALKIFVEFLSALKEEPRRLLFTASIHDAKVQVALDDQKVEVPEIYLVAHLEQGRAGAPISISATSYTDAVRRFNGGAVRATSNWHIAVRRAFHAEEFKIYRMFEKDGQLQAMELPQTVLLGEATMDLKKAPDPEVSEYTYATATIEAQPGIFELLKNIGMEGGKAFGHGSAIAGVGLMNTLARDGLYERMGENVPEFMKTQVVKDGVLIIPPALILMALELGPHMGIPIPEKGRNAVKYGALTGLEHAGFKVTEASLLALWKNLLEPIWELYRLAGMERAAREGNTHLIEDTPLADLSEARVKAAAMRNE